MTCVLRGNKEAVKWLLINGCVLNYRDNLDRTPADMASLYGHETIAALIIKCVGLLKQNRDIIDTINDTDLYSRLAWFFYGLKFFPLFFLFLSFDQWRTVLIGMLKLGYIAKKLKTFWREGQVEIRKGVLNTLQAAEAS